MKYATHDFAMSNGMPASDTDLVCRDPSLTRQEFADECDINVIMARYEKTGVVSHVTQRVPMYIDWTEQPTNLMDALDIMYKADEAFMSLPATVRREFDNDPLKFVDFASNPDNLDKLREYGLAPPAVVEEALVEPSATPAATPPAKPPKEAPKADTAP